MGSPRRIDLTTHRTMSNRSTTELLLAPHNYMDLSMKTTSAVSYTRCNQGKESQFLDTWHLVKEF